MNLTLSAEEVEVIALAMAINESEWVDEFRQDVSKVLRKIATAKNEEGEVNESTDDRERL